MNARGPRGAVSSIPHPSVPRSSGRRRRLARLDVAGESGLQEPAGLLARSPAGQLNDPMADLGSQEGRVGHRVVDPAEFEQGGPEALWIVDLLEGGAEEVSPSIPPLAHLEPTLGGPTPGGVG